MVEAERLHAIRQLEPLGAVAVVDLVGTGQIGLIDGAIGALQVRDRFVEQLQDFLVRVFLRIVVEAELRLVDRFLDDDFAVEVGGDLPAPCLEQLGHAKEVPALFGLGQFRHVDQILP